MKSKRLLCLALAAVLTSATATAWAQTTETISGDVVKTAPIDSSNVNVIHFDKPGSILSFDAPGWTADDAAININSGETMDFTVDTGAGATGELIISGISGKAIMNWQKTASTIDAVLDLTELKSITLTGNSGTAGVGIYMYHYGTNDTSLKIGDDATISDNKGTSGTAIFITSGGVMGSVAGAIEVTLGDNLLVSGNEGYGQWGVGGAFSFQNHSASNATTLDIGEWAKFYDNSAVGEAGYDNRGGAISLTAKSGGTLTIGTGAEFIGNSVTVNSGAVSPSAKATGGGAISAFSDDGSFNVTLGAGSLFSDNRAEVNYVGDHQVIGGGAILMSGVSPELTINGGTRFENNSTTHNGGAILMAGTSSAGNAITINLDTTAGDIVFAGNRHRVTYDANGQPSGDNYNSIYLVADSAAAAINLSGSRNVYFDDPITMDGNGPGAVIMNVGTSSEPFTGFVQFQGVNELGENGMAYLPQAGSTLRLAGERSELILNDFYSEGQLSGSGTISANNGIVFGYLSNTPPLSRISPDGATFDSSMAPTIYKTGGNPYAATPLISPGQAIGALTLTATGLTYFNSATLNIDLASENKSDQITISNVFNGMSTANTVNIGEWVSDDTFTIMRWGGVTDGDSITRDGTFSGGLTVGGMALEGRMQAKASLEVGADNTLKLKTEALDSRPLSWTGDSGNNWNFTDNNWEDDPTGPTIKTFAYGDGVLFNGAGTGDIKVAGQSNATTDYRVQVGQMAITGGSYTFQGGAITGRAVEGEDSSDGKLSIMGNTAEGIFKNTIDFDGGIEISEGAAMTVAFDSADDSVRGFIGSGTTVSVDEGSTLNFDLKFDSSDQVPVYIHGGQLTGDGTVVANLDYTDSPGFLMLNADNSDLTGKIEVTGSTSGGGSASSFYGLILAHKNAAGSAAIDLKSSASELQLDFGPDDGNTIYFDNIVTSQLSSYISLHSGRVSFGGLSNSVGSLVVSSGAVLDFRATDVIGPAGSGYVIIGPDGAVVGGNGGTINGDLYMYDTSILEVAAGGQALMADKISVTGDSVQKRLKADPNWTKGGSYAVLKGGAFSDGSEEKLAGDLSNLGNEGELVWGEDDILYYNHGGSHDIAENVGLNTNQTRVGAAVDSLDKSSPLYDAILNGGTSAQAGYVLDQVSGQQHTAVAGIAREIPLAFTETVSQEVRNLRGNLSGFNPLSAGDAGLGEAQVWVNVGYSRSKFDGGSGRYEADSKAVKAGLGLDKAFDNNWFAGAAILYSHSEIDQDYTRSEAEVNSLTFGLYGGREVAAGSGAFRFTAGTALTLHDIDTERRVRIATLDEKLTADYNGTAWQIFAEGAYGFRINDTWTAEPYLNLAYVHQKLDSFTEEGGLATLHGRSQTDNDFYTTLGGRFTADLTENTALELDLGWQHRFGDKRSESTLSFAQGSTPFTLESVTLDRNQALIGLGLKQNLTDTTTLRVNYNGALGSDSSRHGGEVMLGISF